MSEQTAEATATEAPAETGTEQQQTKPTETVDFWKQKAREQEKRAKENAEAAKRLSEIEEANKTAEQKAADRIEAAEKVATDARNEALRFRIATEFKLSTDDAAALEHVGSEDGMRLVAERLAARADERTKTGNVVPTEGTRPSTTSDPKRNFLREIRGDE